jgi:translation initiation factor RLI1
VLEADESVLEAAEPERVAEPVELESILESAEDTLEGAEPLVGVALESTLERDAEVAVTVAEPEAVAVATLDADDRRLDTADETTALDVSLLL